jgi:NTE family protein
VIEALDAVPGRSSTDERSVALALGGGGARGLAHLGVLEVLEAEGIRPTFLAGTSIGGLVGALWASAIPATEIIALARGFRFPRRFVPGRVLTWEQIFPSAVPRLEGRTFEDLRTPLAVSAVDLVAGEEVVLHAGPLLPAIRATCAVPGVLPPERLGGRCLVDGGVMNVLPVDLAWSWEPDTVIAVNIVASPRQTVCLDSRYARIATALGRMAPNPLTAHLAYEIAMRAVEVALDRQRALAIAMTGPEVLIDVDLGDVSIGDFHRLDEVVEIGRRATRVALPRLRAALAAPSCVASHSDSRFTLHIDPVCRMAISPGRARAQCDQDGITYYFCSVNCRDSFERHRDRYGGTRPACGSKTTMGGVQSGH